MSLDDVHELEDIQQVIDCFIQGGRKEVLAYAKQQH